MRPERKEFLIHHAHAHLDVFVDGRPIAVPAAIGIDIDDPPNTLGQFFTEWSVRLSRSCVGEPCSPGRIAFYVNGKPYQQDPRAIELTDRKEIAIVIGTPPSRIPKTADSRRHRETSRRTPAVPDGRSR